MFCKLLPVLDDILANRCKLLPSSGDILMEQFVLIELSDDIQFGQYVFLPIWCGPLYIAVPERWSIDQTCITAAVS